MLCSANCGNLASTTNRISNIWDYRNRLTSYGTSLATTTFGYDHGVERVWKATGSATTTYASKLYNTDGTTITKHIFSPMGDMIATIIGTGASTTATTTYIHTDHLGGTAATTNVEGDVVELSDFHPYGSPRVSLNYIGTPEQRKYAGTERDTSLDYMLNRYYSSDQGRFINQDRVFWQLPSGILLDPQLMQSYSYARDNPIILKDTDGQMPTIVAGALIGGGIGLGVQATADLLSGQWSGWQAYTGAAAGGAVQGAFWGSGAGVVALVASGALSGATQGVVRESLQYATGDPSGFQMGQIGGDVGASVFGNLGGGLLMRTVGVPAIAGITSGRNSFDEIIQQLFTKLQNGMISNVSIGTQAKMGVSYGINSFYSSGIQAVIQARQQAAQSYNASIGVSTGGGGSMPGSNSLWVTPSGAVVTWGGSLDAGPAAQSTPMTKQFKSMNEEVII